MEGFFRRVDRSPYDDYDLSMGQGRIEGLESARPPSFEQGPIRPPSEARSLLVRVTRNCPWNKCEFCPVYKGTRFSKRTVDEVKSDIRAMAWWREKAVEESWRLGFGGRLDGRSIQAVYRRGHGSPEMTSVLTWMTGGGKTAFLQDADNLIHKTGDLAEILTFLRRTFPEIERVTTYSRSRTINKKSAGELKALKDAGLDRVHVGLESGSDSVLEKIRKGATGRIHVEAGLKVKEAGLELSEYLMPGLGGKSLSEEHALESARVLSEIDPHFIRLRSLGLRQGIPLFDVWQRGEFDPINDEEIAAEIRLFVERLEGISSYMASDHILNLLPEVEGRFPEEKGAILDLIDRFLGLPAEERMIYVVGRRFGILGGLDDLDDPSQRRAAQAALARVREHGGPDVHETIRQIVSQFI